MLKQVYIIRKDRVLHQRNYAKGLDDLILTHILSIIKQSILCKHGEEIGFYDFYKVRISFIAQKDLDLIFLFVTGLTDDFSRIKVELFKLRKEFLNLFGEVIKDNIKPSMIEHIDPIIDIIHRNLKPKISLVGFSGVGKTTITKLIKAEEIPMQHIPTITGDVATIKIGKLYFFLWDFAGQEQFNFLWSKFIKESDAVLLITDSTLENVEKSKYFLELINEAAPNAHLAIIANKQDLPDAISVDTIESLMGIKTYTMIAIDPNNRIKMLQIIADLLDINLDMSPLLKPIIERDRLIEEIQNTINKGNYKQTIVLLEKIRDLCIEIGDDSFGLECNEKAERLKEILKSQLNLFV